MDSSSKLDNIIEFAENQAALYIYKIAFAEKIFLNYGKETTNDLALGENNF